LQVYRAALKLQPSQRELGLALARKEEEGDVIDTNIDHSARQMLEQCNFAQRKRRLTRQPEGAFAILPPIKVLMLYLMLDSRKKTIFAMSWHSHLRMEVRGSSMSMQLPFVHLLMDEKDTEQQHLSQTEEGSTPFDSGYFQMIAMCVNSIQVSVLSLSSLAS
jgi:hypothetical protein